MSKAVGSKKEETKKEVQVSVPDNNTKTVTTSVLPSGWRVAKKAVTGNVKYYLLVSCKYSTDKETGESKLTKNPLEYDGSNVFRIVKESISKFERFNGHISTFPDLVKTKTNLVTKASGRTGLKNVPETSDYIHSLQDTGEGDINDAKIFGGLKRIDFVDKNNHENKLRAFTGNLKNYLEKENVN